jgi:hypothetical protein
MPISSIADTSSPDKTPLADVDSCQPLDKGSILDNPSRSVSTKDPPRRPDRMTAVLVSVRAPPLCQQRSGVKWDYPVQTSTLDTWNLAATSYREGIARNDAGRPSSTERMAMRCGRPPWRMSWPPHQRPTTCQQLMHLLDTVLSTSTPACVGSQLGTSMCPRRPSMHKK